MPLYEYKCHKCGDVFEKMQKFSDEPLATHEGECGGEVERLISSPALQFKGSGFYITDYAKSGSSNTSKSSSESKTDSKPAASTSSSDSGSSSTTKKDS